MIIASLDLGTNTFHLLVCRADLENHRFEVLHQEERFVFIGKGGISQGNINKEGLNRAIDRLRAFREIVDKYQPQHEITSATSAFREANNRDEVLLKIEKETGFTPTVLTGRDEAALIKNAAQYLFPMQKQAGLILDIGGGSSEFIVYKDRKSLFMESIEIGAQRLLDLGPFNDPLNTKDQRKILDHIGSKLDSHLEEIRKHPVKSLIGVAGSFETLRDIREGNRNSSAEQKISTGEYREIADRLLTSAREQRLSIPGMEAERVDMIVMACLQINYVISKLHIEEILVCPYSLKEGAVLDFINRHS